MGNRIVRSVEPRLTCVESHHFQSSISTTSSQSALSLASYEYQDATEIIQAKHSKQTHHVRNKQSKKTQKQASKAKRADNRTTKQLKHKQKRQLQLQKKQLKILDKTRKKRASETNSVKSLSSTPVEQGPWSPLVSRMWSRNLGAGTARDAVRLSRRVDVEIPKQPDGFDSLASQLEAMSRQAFPDTACPSPDTGKNTCTEQQQQQQQQQHHHHHHQQEQEHHQRQPHHQQPHQQNLSNIERFCLCADSISKITNEPNVEQATRHLLADTSADAKDNPDIAVLASQLFEVLGNDASPTVRIFKCLHQKYVLEGVARLVMGGPLDGIATGDDRSEQGWRINISKRGTLAEPTIVVVHQRHDRIAMRADTFVTWEMEMVFDKCVDTLLSSGLRLTGVDLGATPVSPSSTQPLDVLLSTLCQQLASEPTQSITVC